MGGGEWRSIEQSRLLSAGRAIKTRGWGGGVPAALIAALAANLLDAGTTWIAITHYGGREAGVFAESVIRAWGLIAGIVVVKGVATAAVVGVALTGTAGDARWWRVPPHRRWVIAGALWTAAAWFGYLAVHNALGVWLVFHLTVP